MAYITNDVYMLFCTKILVLFSLFCSYFRLWVEESSHSYFTILPKMFIFSDNNSYYGHIGYSLGKFIFIHLCLTLNNVIFSD